MFDPSMKKYVKMILITHNGSYIKNVYMSPKYTGVQVEVIDNEQQMESFDNAKIETSNEIIESLEMVPVKNINNQTEADILIVSNNLDLNVYATRNSLDVENLTFAIVDEFSVVADKCNVKIWG